VVVKRVVDFSVEPTLSYINANLRGMSSARNARMGIRVLNVAVMMFAGMMMRRIPTNNDGYAIIPSLAALRMDDHFQ
jgi:hypothetical protein